MIDAARYLRAWWRTWPLRPHGFGLREVDRRPILWRRMSRVAEGLTRSAR